METGIFLGKGSLEMQRRVFFNRNHISHHVEMPQFFRKLKIPFNYQTFSVSQSYLEYPHHQQALKKQTGILDS